MSDAQNNNENEQQNYYNTLNDNELFNQANQNFTNAESFASLRQYKLAIDGYTQTISNLDKIVNKDSHNLKQFLFMAHHNRSNAYRNIGNYDNVIQDYQKIINLDQSKASEYYRYISDVYDKKNDYENSLININKAIDIDSDDSRNYNLRGEIYFHNEEYENAINDFNKAIELNPNLDVAYYNRGYYYATQSKYENAIIDYDMAIKINPNYITAILAKQKAEELQRADIQATKSLENVTDFYRIEEEKHGFFYVQEHKNSISSTNKNNHSYGFIASWLLLIFITISIATIMYLEYNFLKEKEINQSNIIDYLAHFIIIMPLLFLIYLAYITLRERVKISKSYAHKKNVVYMYYALKDTVDEDTKQEINKVLAQTIGNDLTSIVLKNTKDIPISKAIDNISKLADIATKFKDKNNKEDTKTV